MISWLVRRLGWSVLVLVIVSTATFAIFFAIPNDPASLVAGKYATPETVALVRRRLGLDKPKPVQLALFLSRAARGDLGYSYTSQQPDNPSDQATRATGFAFFSAARSSPSGIAARNASTISGSNCLPDCLRSSSWAVLWSRALR